jgi:Calx-beta domain
VNFASGVTVNYAVTAGNAATDDFTLLGTGTLTFDAFQASKTISLLIHPDALAEGTETLTVTLSSPTGAPRSALPARSRSASPMMSAVFFASDRITVAEATLSVAITLLRSGPSTGGFTIPVTIAPPPSSTAVAGRDHPATFSGVTARFASNQMSAVVVIPLLNDAFLDGSTQLVLELGTFHGGRLDGQRRRDAADLPHPGPTGTWTCDSATEGEGSGTWRATRTSLIP